MAEKVDLYKERRELFKATSKPRELDVPPLDYLTVEGGGKPGGPHFQEKIGALYQAAYTMKFASKDEGRDYRVMMLEGTYWTGSEDPLDFEAEEMTWKLMMMVPDFIDEEMVKKAKEEVRAKDLKKKRGTNPHIEKVSLERVEEGRCVQMLHVGPYDQEMPTVEKLLSFAGEIGLKARPGHHEIYLSDPRRVAPEKIRTIIRLPVG